MRRLALTVALAVLVVACSEDEPAVAPSPSTTATTAAGTASTSTVPEASGEVRVRLERVATFESPVNMTAAGDGALYVVEQQGAVRAVDDGGVRSEAVLNITDEVKAGGEQGLLGLAFSNDRSHLYVNFTDTRGDTRIVEYRFDGQKADERSRRELLRVDQPFPNHNGGHIVVDSNDVLWIGMGDGGSAGDPQNNGQRDDTLLGKLVRIDLRDDDAEPEVWAKGLRNPWRFHIDEEGDALWVADVGQDAVEEINRVPLDRRGVNYGWRAREGTQPFRGGEKPAGAVDPVYEYSLDDGACAVTGGGVYRGQAFPTLRGAYLFADFCIGDVQALLPSGEVLDLGVSVTSPSSFGTDDDGEMYVLSQRDGGMYRLVPS